MWTPVALPEQVPATEGMAPVSGTSLWYWDTGGEGPAIVLLHAATGSGAFWGYQQPALAKAGYRVIGYSRRGHFRSGEGDPDNPGLASADLKELVDHLGISEFHVLGLAAGGTVALDYALSYPGRLLSLTLASTILGVTDKSYIDLLRLILPSGFMALPKDFQELSPSYRAGNPAGTAAWLKLEEEAIPGKQIGQKNANAITWDSVETITTPTLLLAGSADLYTPPSMLRLQASHLRHAQMEIIDEAGHAPHWEQPDRFNTILLNFLKRH